MNGDLILDYGPLVAVSLWLVQQVWRQYQAWQGRRWNKADKSEDKVAQLYERLIEQQRDTLTIIDRNSDVLVGVQQALDQVRLAFEKELENNTRSLRDLTERISRLEKRMEK